MYAKKIFKGLLLVAGVSLASGCSLLMDNASGEDAKYAPDRERSYASEASMSADGIAMNGYDPVHMLRTGGEEVVGDEQYRATQLHGGPTYLFASAENLETFLEDPHRYTPKAGGFCMWGMVDYRDTTTGNPVNVPHGTPTPPVSQGGVYAVLDKGTPNARIVGFYNRKVYERFLVDPELYEASADHVWANDRARALVPWSAVSKKVKLLHKEQEQYKQRQKRQAGR